MNKVICRCNREFETIVELLEHVEDEHTPAGMIRKAATRTYHPRLAKPKPAIIYRLGPSYYAPRDKQEKIPNDL